MFDVVHFPGLLMFSSALCSGSSFIAPTLAGLRRGHQGSPVYPLCPLSRLRATFSVTLRSLFTLSLRLCAFPFVPLTLRSMSDTRLLQPATSVKRTDIAPNTAVFTVSKPAQLLRHRMSTASTLIASLALLAARHGDCHSLFNGCASCLSVPVPLPLSSLPRVQCLLRRFSHPPAMLGA